jgi:hypothetical protein
LFNPINCDAGFVVCVGWGISMSDGEQRSRVSFTDIYFFVKSVSSLFAFGITVIMLSEIYLLFAGEPRPGWLVSMESFYGTVLQVVASGAKKAFETDPACSVQVFRFDNDGKVAGKDTYRVKTLLATSRAPISSNSVTWQQVDAASNAGSPIGWVDKPDFEGKAALAQCK